MMKRRFEMDDDGRRGATLGAGNRNCGAAKIRSFSFSLSLSLVFLGYVRIRDAGKRDRCDRRY